MTGWIQAAETRRIEDGEAPTTRRFSCTWCLLALGGRSVAADLLEVGSIVSHLERRPGNQEGPLPVQEAMLVEAWAPAAGPGGQGHTHDAHSAWEEFGA